MTRRRHAHLKNKTQRASTTSSRLSSKNIQFLKRSWKSICKYKSSIPALNPTPITDQDLAHIKSAGMYPHIPEKIRREFESTEQQGARYETKLARGRKVEIYIAAPKSLPTNEYLNNIIAWLNFIDNVASHKCAQTLHIYLLLTDAKKRLPEIDTEPIDMIHANTAFTTSCSSVNDIFVFRREEWFKVLMHETFHCFGLDFSSSIGDKSNSHILSLFPNVDPKTDIRLYETFCEMWGEVFHLMFCLFTTSSGECLQFSESKFYKALRKEQLFSIYQSNKILQRAGYQYKELFSTSSSLTKKKYNEKTQAFSYYVIKSLMLWNLDRFMKWCAKYAHESIQFNQDQDHIAEYCNFVEELTKRDGGYKKMTERINIRKNKAGGKNIEDTNTLRMTSIDPEWSDHKETDNKN